MKLRLAADSERPRRVTTDTSRDTRGATSGRMASEASPAARAKAEGLKAQAKALSGAGGRNMVKLQVAEALKDKPIVFMPATGTDLRKTDVNELLRTYGAAAATQEQ